MRAANLVNIARTIQRTWISSYHFPADSCFVFGETTYKGYSRYQNEYYLEFEQGYYFEDIYEDIFFCSFHLDTPQNVTKHKIILSGLTMIVMEREILPEDTVNVQFQLFSATGFPVTLHEEPAP